MLMIYYRIKIQVYFFVHLE